MKSEESRCLSLLCHLLGTGATHNAQRSLQSSFTQSPAIRKTPEEGLSNETNAQANTPSFGQTESFLRNISPTETAEMLSCLHSPKSHAYPFSRRIEA